MLTCVHTFSAKSLFHVEKKTETRINKANVKTEFPFDLCFRIIPERSDIFRGPGIYWVTFNDELIYVGSYSSVLPNLISDRWLKHIQTFTNRGYRLGFNALTKKDSIPAKLKSFFDRDCYRYCDTGTVTSLERLSFASRNFDEFQSSDGGEIIEKFRFYYCRLDSALAAKEIESGLIEELRPICNSLSPRRGNIANSLVRVIKEQILYTLKPKA